MFRCYHFEKLCLKKSNHLPQIASSPPVREGGGGVGGGVVWGTGLNSLVVKCYL